MADNTKMMLEFLSEPFPPNAVEKREGAHGKMLDYIATETVIRRLNKVAMQWDFRKTSHEWTEPVTWTDKYQKERVSRTLVVFGEMTIPGLGTRSGTGVQVVEDGRSGEDLIKGALSDCLKNCAKQFGVGIELYGPDLEAGEMPEQPNLPARDRSTSQNTIPQQTQAYIPPGGSGGEMQYASTRGRVMGSDDRPAASAQQPATPRQLKFIQAIAREHGIGEDELNSEVEQLYGRAVADLDRRDASAFIERLQSRRNVTELAS